VSTTPLALAARARRAYEGGRLALGFRTAWAVVPMAILSWIACDEPAATTASALALAGVVTAAVWRGQDLARGARIGLLACVPSLLVPLLVVASGHLCDGSVCLLFPAACLVGGLLSGLGLGWLARRAALGQAGLVTAGLATWLGGTFGCVVMGSIGVAVLVLGLGAGLAPALVLRRA
jgi:hypothetical protein